MASLSAIDVFGEEPQPSTLEFYRDVLERLLEARVPFIVGGGFAFSYYTGIQRYTKDLDLFVRPQDADWALGVVAEAGFRAELIAPHWLGKIFADDGAFIDIVFSSGNGVAVVDDEWLQRAEPAEVLGLDVMLSPVEEMIWSKGYVLERERFDGADIAHLIRARGEGLDWERLFRRFDRHWHLLFAHLLLFRFIYPSHQSLIPRWVMRGLLGRLQHELAGAVPDRPVCQGTLLSARQYLVDIERWGYEDARLDPEVQMTSSDIDLLTRSVKAEDACAKRNPKPRGAG